MSELMNTQNTERGFRWHLLTSVSALALLASVTMRDAKAADDDADRPTVWIELGGEMDHITGQGNAYSPAFLTNYFSSSILQQRLTPVEAQNPPPFSFGGEGKITFQPENSDWVFSAAVRYGRSNNTRHVNHQTTKVHYNKYKSGVPIASQIANGNVFTQEKFVDSHISHGESHAVLDFMAGKDVGLGMFGHNGSSVLSLGVRFAQFSNRSSDDIRARPDLRFKYEPSAAAPSRVNFGAYFHTYHAYENASRSFHGIGPSIAWNGSAAVVGNSQHGEITFDWGANAAFLFGRQKASARHFETGRYWTRSAQAAASLTQLVVYQNPSRGHDTNRSITVPTVGGFAGMSFEFSSAKVSLGYRADLFFNAMDVGIDARKSATLGFYGPFASVSIGLGG
jgi:iron complex outermembrane receptor protein